MTVETRDGTPGAAGAAWNRQLLRHVVTVGLFAAGAGALRIAQDIAIAWRYGAGPMTDAYFFVLNIVLWPVAVALSTLTFMVAPAEASLRVNAARAVEGFRAELLALVLGISLVALPLMYTALQKIVTLSAVGLAPATAEATAQATGAMFAVTALGLVAALLSAWLISSARQVVTLVDAFPALVLASLLAAAGPAPAGVLFWGTTAGFTLQLLVLMLLLRGDNALPWPRFSFASAGWRGAWRGSTAILVGQVLFALVPVVDQLFAARMGAGAIASLGYANRLLLGLLGLTALVLQRASLPVLSRLAAMSPIAARHAAMRLLLPAAGIGTLVAGTAALLADAIISLLYERGQFGPDDRAFVASVLQYGTLQVPFYFVGIVATTALAAVKDYAALAQAAAIGFVVKVAANTAFAAAGPAGLQLATAAMYGVNAAFVWWALQRRSTTSTHCRLRSPSGHADPHDSV